MTRPANEPYDIAACRGVTSGECRFALDTPATLADKLAQTIEDAGWPEFLKQHVAGPISRHNQLRIAVSACPNGCSKPHIADIGVIRACEPECNYDACTQCGICEKVCPDKAVHVTVDGPVFDFDACVRCGLCVQKCRERALSCGKFGYRVMLGGKLGRHPRLASEVPGIYSEEIVLAMAGTAIRWYMDNYKRGLRFGTLVAERGDELFAELEKL